MPAAAADTPALGTPHALPRGLTMGDSLTRIGYDVKDGKTPEYLDYRAAAAWFAAVDLVKARLDIDLSKRILQALGDADASAGVHRAPGVCVDIRIWSLTRAQINAVVALLRECGFAATWYRDWTGNQHIHAATDIGIWTPALYQVTAVKAGYDGLGSGGKGGKDTHPKPSAWRTAQTGAAWARAQLAQQEEDDMPTAQEIAAETVWQLRASSVTANGRKAGLIDHLATSFVDGKTALQGIAQVSAQVRAVAEKVGAPIDTDALVAGVVAGILPDLIAALSLAAGAEGLSEEQVGRIATATADELAKRVAA